MLIDPFMAEADTGVNFEPATDLFRTLKFVRPILETGKEFVR
jgi:hypothetical protein